MFFEASLGGRPWEKRGEKGAFGKATMRFMKKRADVKSFFDTLGKGCHTRNVLEEQLRAGECVTDRTAGTRGMRSPGPWPGRSHNNNWLSRAAKIFPGSEEPGKFFAFRSAPTLDSQQ